MGAQLTGIALSTIALIEAFLIEPTIKQYRPTKWHLTNFWLRAWIEVRQDEHINKYDIMLTHPGYLLDRISVNYA